MTTPGSGAPSLADAGVGSNLRRRPPLVLMFAVTVTGILGNTLITAPSPDILRAFSQPDSRAGWITASATLPGILVAPIIGFLADRFGRRAILVPCLAIFGIFGVAAAFASSFEMLLLFRLGQGFGSAGLINLAVVLIGDHWTGEERARFIGFNAAVLTASITVLPVVGGALTAWGGWRWSFAPYGLALITAWAVWKTLEGGDGRPGLAVSDQLGDAWVVLRVPAVSIAIGLGFVLFALIFGLFLTVMPILLDRQFGLDAFHRGIWLAVPALGSTTAALLLTRTRRRVGVRGLMLLATVFIAMGFGFIGLAVVLPALFVASYFYGLGEGSLIPTLQDVVASVAPTASRGAVIAVWVGAARAGQTVGPLLSGKALDIMEPSTVFLIGGLVAALLVPVQLVVRRHLVDAGG